MLFVRNEDVSLLSSQNKKKNFLLFQKKKGSTLNGKTSVGDNNNGP